MSPIGYMPTPLRRGPSHLGRPKVSDIPTERARHIDCARLYYGSDWTVAQIARHLQVSRDTVYRWVDLAMTYDDIEVDEIREHFVKSSTRDKRPH
jgi:DNA-binding transcriptional regulator LsrR (DeoR family)